MKKDFEKDISEKVVKFFTQKKFYILSYFVLLFFLGYLAYEKFPFFKKNGAESKLKLEKNYAAWIKNAENEDLYKQLIQTINKNPELAVLRRKDVFQKLIYEKSEKIKDLESNIFDKTDPHITCFVAFAKASILISQDKYEEALTHSLALHEKLDQNDLEIEHFKLYLYNLLRIPFLYKKLKNNSKEMDAWNQLEKVLSEKANLAKGFLEELEQNNQFKLLDYIKFRKTTLPS